MKYLITNLDRADPAINLATEEYLVRHYDISHDYLFLYINQPAVVVGRHQNIYQEVNLQHILKNNIPILRRFSGGGTVYHDGGNLNFSFITRYEKFKFNNYRYFNQPIVDFLNNLGVPAEQTDSNDIVVRDKKISGNAQFTSRDRMVSHGTLLFNSDLNHLSDCLRVIAREITSRATKSRRSPVTNISDYLKETLTIEEFRERLIRHLFQDETEIQRRTIQKNEQEKILALADNKYRQWDWTFGESPDCSIKSSGETAGGQVHCQLEISKGHIKVVEFEGPGSSVSEAKYLSDILEGKRYYPKDVLEILGTDPSLSEQKIQGVMELLF